MPEQQLDLFADSSPPPAETAAAAPPPPVAPSELDDAALLAAIPVSGRTDGPPLAAEIGRRRLASAIPILADYCRRFAGFGAHHALPEQVAALAALAAIGGPEAARTVALIIERCWVQGPTLATGVAAAAQLGSRLPMDTVLALLRHPEPPVRRDACSLTRRGPEVLATLTDLMGDLHPDVSLAAACALGRMGETVARHRLLSALHHGPTVRAIEALVPIADADCIVLLGRTAHSAPPVIAAAARTALEALEHPLAERLLEHLP